MFVIEHTTARDSRSRMCQETHTDATRHRPVFGLFLSLVAFAWIVTLLALAASITPIQMPVVPVWLDAVIA